ncbi:MAG: dipeptide epimerase [Candidatus Eisenbacteria sp.]|nr:dipeptide epimerase [Candidatus Eisenbacteria bacterium]
MKIAEIEVLQRAVPYKKPFAIAGGSTSLCEHALVRITTTDGVFGLGEAATMPSYSEETHTSVEAVLREKLIPAVRGCDPFDINAIMARLDAAASGNSIAKAAIDLALHDLVGKLTDQPVYRLLGGCFRERVPLAWAIGLGGIEEVAGEAAKYAGKGFGTIKIKVGRDAERDIEAVRAVREAIGSRVRLRVDANQGYDYDTAIGILPKMERFDLELIEQPLPRSDIEGMGRLCAALDTPIMADESVFNAQDAIELIRQRAADIINIKIMKPCGLRGSRAVADIAAGAGIPCLIGSMVEMGIGTAAGLHFAIATPNIDFACEMIGPEMLAADIIEQAPFLATCGEGYFALPTGTGLGVSLKG